MPIARASADSVAEAATVMPSGDARPPCRRAASTIITGAIGIEQRRQTP